MVAVKVLRSPLTELFSFRHSHILTVIPEQVLTSSADLNLNSSPRSASLNVLDLSKIRFEISTFQHQENDLPTISKNVLLGFLK